MILQALADYYDVLLQGPNSSEIPKPGYCRADVSYALNLSSEGDLLNLIPLFVTRLQGKKEVQRPQTHIVPEQVIRSSGVSSNCLCDNSAYVLAIDKGGKPKRTLECFQAFCQLHQAVLAGVNCPEARALLNYLAKWQPQQATINPAVQPYLEHLLAGPNLVFKLEGGGFIHQNQEICAAWEQYRLDHASTLVGQCLITGETAPIAVLNPSVKGLKGGKSTGCSLVSFNADAYCSYGKEQGANAPISQKAAFAYGTVLNYLTKDSYHRLFMGDSTVVYWAESPDKAYQDGGGLMFNPEDLAEYQMQEGTVNSKYDPRAIKSVGDVMAKVANGEYITPITDLDPNVKFYILGVSPNAARLSVRFFVQNTFGQFVDKMAKHYQDLQIEKAHPNDRTFLPMWQLLEQTVLPESKDKACSPLLAGAVLRAILNGSPYPAILFSNVMLRLKAGDSINYPKASIIKGYLLRKNINTEVLTMSLNTQTENVAYNLGRLFAVLEKLQYDANGSSNIRERYFSAFSATPRIVFPLLLKLSQHHIAKSDYGNASDKRIAEILDKLEIDTRPIPSTLSLENQGTLVLGYYHQKNDLYKKKTVEAN